jgi:hypothetical protein
MLDGITDQLEFGRRKADAVTDRVARPTLPPLRNPRLAEVVDLVYLKYGPNHFSNPRSLRVRQRVKNSV